jgi:hypothetical protein
MGKAGREHVLRTATLGKTIADLDRLYRQWLFRGGKRREGYRRWVTRLRLPILRLVAIYLNWRLQVVEYRWIARWEVGWRPWHDWIARGRGLLARGQRLIGRLCNWRPTVQALKSSLSPVNLAARIPVPGRSLASTWFGKVRRGEARLDTATARLFVLDLIAAQPPTLRTFIYESIATYRQRTRP